MADLSRESPSCQLSAHERLLLAQLIEAVSALLGQESLVETQK
jgi:hypothetical protein